MADSNFKGWLDQAWTDWIQPLGLIVVLGVAYLLYTTNVIAERTSGLVLILAVLLGTLGTGVVPALGLARRGSDRAMIWLLAALALAGAAYPTLHVAWASSPLASVTLTPDQLKATVETHASGPYEVVVSGKLKDAGSQEAQADFDVEITGDGKDEVTGEIKRSMHHYRTGRRGGTTSSVEERNETTQRLEHVRGSTLAISAAGIDDALDGSLMIGIRSAGPRREVFWTLGALAVLLGLILDARLAVDIREEDRKVRGPKRDVSYLCAVTGVLLVFAINFPMEATPHALVKPGIGAFLLALLTGGTGGWLLGAFARLASRPARKR